MSKAGVDWVRQWPTGSASQPLFVTGGTASDPKTAWAEPVGQAFLLVGFDIGHYVLDVLLAPSSRFGNHTHHQALLVIFMRAPDARLVVL